ncbi:hypothetical protein P3T36_003001 [Kitasatospora sp. MAP12-15]|uniref:hypothetical protein n=1 Tax=unclassified Kitasatospora TaxID=2633591 RepID=UPI002473DD08|nr:hypothetical protein [Kitasatospora sp. MAP12-44]MDH6108870.1 hypothetical protein [Kitasatospora sp. MAP12-44]
MTDTGFLAWLSETAEATALLKCVQCKSSFWACPECVNTIRIDPETNLPPDVVVVNGEAVYTPDFTPEAMARSVKQPACDNCIQERNDSGTWPERVPTSVERHRRSHF